MRICCAFSAIAASLISLAAVFADEQPPAAAKPQSGFSVRLVDESGQPVVGAQAGLSFNFDSRNNNEGEFESRQISDENGLVTFKDSPDPKYASSVYVRHRERQLVGARTVSLAESRETVSLTLFPECKVTCRVGCRELEERGHPTEAMIGYVMLDGVRLLGYFLKPNPELVLYLPPGKFTLDTYGKGFHDVYSTLEIPRGRREMDLGTINHPAKQLALLEGQPAPELPPEISEWKNGPPVKLTDLRGKVVLLEFWGWWCGPCIGRGIPEMLRLQEEYEGKGLAIIGIHVDLDKNEVDSVKKLDEKLEWAREKRWQGKDITFPVALVANQPTPFGPGIKGMAKSPLSAAYGVNGYPTTVLIDKQGLVVGEFHPEHKPHQEKLQALLDAP